MALNTSGWEEVGSQPPCSRGEPFPPLTLGLLPLRGEVFRTGDSGSPSCGCRQPLQEDAGRPNH